MFPGSVCVSLTPRRIDDVLRAQTAGADCMEIRLDYLDDPGEADQIAWRELPLPAIATCRGRDRGGRFEGSVNSELGILDRAVASGARYVDVDYRIARPFPSADVIGSYHDFEGTPEDLDTLMDSICRGPVSVGKIATMAGSWSDNRRLFRLLGKSWAKPVIVIGMGPVGQITRVLGPSRGSALTYAALEEQSAPGQLALGELIGTYRFPQITRQTRVLGIIGNPVDHSRSPELHNRAFQTARLDYVYLRFPVEIASDFCENAEAIGIEGFSVTIPHKVEVMKYLDEVTPEAEAVGAVNTVYREDGRWKGDNTDVYGIRVALKDFDLRGKSIVILGTGGAARAAVAALEPSSSITVLSRTHAVGTLDWSRPIRVDRLENYGSYDPDLLINATPVGMFPDLDSTPVVDVGNAAAVFDMVYNPPRTRLLKEAERRGKRTFSGTAMFIAQAARQFERWTGYEAPAAVYCEGGP